MKKLTYGELEFTRIDTSPYSSLYYNPKVQMALCIADVEYIPIEHFKEMFLAVEPLIEKYPMKHFLFDKRSLRTFHQPSMEWYFTSWKPMIKAHGLTSHFKILPKLEWFVQAVNAGKSEIYKKYGENILDGITVQYVDSIESAIALCENGR